MKSRKHRQDSIADLRELNQRVEFITNMLKIHLEQVTNEDYTLCLITNTTHMSVRKSRAIMFKLILFCLTIGTQMKVYNFNLKILK